jgi:acyl-CoA synthetase (NDP forming)
MTEEGFSREVELTDESLPAYPFPEAAARALAKVAEYAERRNEPLGAVLSFPDLQTDAIQAVCRAAAAERGAGWLTVAETRQVLELGGFPVPPGGVARDAEAAVAIAEAIGYPVAVKLASHTIVHKTELDAVRLGLADAAAVRAAFDEIRGRLAGAGLEYQMEGVLVQPMFDEGVEVMLGVTHDELFGPLVSFGLGGIHVEILKDVTFRVTPVTDRDAERMMREIKGYRLLEGYRGHPPADVPALERLVQRLARLAEGVPAIRELDFNPVFALEPGHGTAIVEARIYVAL